MFVQTLLPPMASSIAIALAMKLKPLCFKNNINLLLSNLALVASYPKSSFYSTTAGIGNGTVYAQYLCRGLVTQQFCHDCVASSAQFLSETCVNHREAIVWHMECMLRYSSDKNYSSFEKRRAGAYYCSQESVPNEGQFNKKLDYLVAHLIAQASYMVVNAKFCYRKCQNQ